MHESVFANQIIYEAKKHGDVQEIEIEVGELAAVPANDLIEFMKRAVPWKIKFKQKDAVVECDCGFEGRPVIVERGHDFFFIECPKCASIPEILEGDKIKLVSVKVK